MDQKVKNQIESAIEELYANNQSKLKQICNKEMIRFGGISQKDYDCFYSRAGLEISVAIKHKLFDPSKGKTPLEYFTSIIKRSIWKEMTDRNRGKRQNFIEIEEVDGDGNITKKKQFIPTISIDMPIGEENDMSIKDTLQSDFDMDVTLSNTLKEYQDEKVQLFLDSLPIIQKQIIEMKMEEVPVSEIKQRLMISDKEYNDVMESIKENRLITLFNRNSKNKQRKFEEKPMEEKVIINDDDLIMDIDTTDNHRVDTETLDSLLEDKSSGELDCNYISQREPFQWCDEQVNKYYSRILNNQPIPEIVVCETVEAGRKVSYLVEGLQRISYAEAFKENRIPVKAKGAEFTKIKYRKYVYDENGNKVKDENGRPIFTIEIFDITNKYYKDLPEFLQKRFDKYNITVTRFFNCTYKMIDYHIRNYNNHEGMTKSHYGITSVSNKVSTNIKGLSKRHPFFMNNVKCSNKSRKRGALEEMVARSIMATFFIEDWKRECIDAFKFVDQNMSDEQLKKFTDNVTRLSKVADRTVKELFTTTNTHVWLAVFNAFSNLGIDDRKFVEFMQYFESNLKDKLINGRTYNDVNKRNTKDKITVKNKINVLIDLMMDYLHIDETEENQHQDVVEFIADVLSIDADTITDDMNTYNEDLDLLLKKHVWNGSELLDDENRPSLLAIVVYSYVNDVKIDDWFAQYAKRNNYYQDQKVNYLHMKNDLDRYCEEHEEKDSNKNSNENRISA